MDDDRTDRTDRAGDEAGTPTPASAAGPPPAARGTGDAVREVAETGTALDPAEAPAPADLSDAPGSTGPGAG